MLRPFTLALVMLGSVAAGCLAPSDLDAARHQGAASTALFDLNLTKAERLPFAAKDGTKLDVAAWRPVANGSADAKFPVLVDIGPYYGNAGGDMMTLSGFDQRTVQYFVPRGYAFARVSVRGTGLSEGCFDLGGATEQQDIHDVVEFLAKEPWSTGSVAVIGKSYDGTTPWQAAITQPKGLKTIVPISGITDMYRYTFHDGTTYPENLGFETYYNLLVDEDVDPFTPTVYAGPQDAQKNAARTCWQDNADQSAQGAITIGNGDHGTAFWKARDYELSWSKVQVPVFMVHRLHDWNVKPDNAVPLYNNLTVPKMAWLGQWEHNYPGVNTYKPEWSRHDWNETLLTWFDHWLKGVDNNWTSLAHVEAQDQAGEWRNSTAWPPADAEPVTVYLGPSGALSAAPPAAGVVTLSADPRVQTPLGGELRAKFATAALSKDVTLVGMPTVSVTLSLDRPAGNLVAIWYDVLPNGSWVEWDHGSRELMHRDTREQGSPVTPGATFTTMVNLYPQETTLAAGHKLGLALAPEDPAWIEPSPLGQGATYTVQLGEKGTALHALALPGGAAAFGAAPS